MRHNEEDFKSHSHRPLVVPDRLLGDVHRVRDQEAGLGRATCGSGIVHAYIEPGAFRRTMERQSFSITTGPHPRLLRS